ncbi:hypothetical protein [Pseudofrankia sp. DC12]|uniref:hypothetical protein n=1 Tax=Pseudofrankia sp. DC12 TaxID=683315 RepID=UPI000697D92B|nr:hypothetical protein [Pseudofrankia sp. DC12]
MGWHGRAEKLVVWDGPVLDAALMLLEHAASGLLHWPVFDAYGSSSALADVHLAVLCLEDCGLEVPPSYPIGGERVAAGDVRGVLATAAVRLVAGLVVAVEPGLVARAALFTREALAALGDG